MIPFARVREWLEPVAARLPQPPLAVNRHTLRVPELREELDGFCIAQVSDLHVGDDHWGPQQAEEASQVIREARPDVIVNTGDYLEGIPPWDRVERVLSLFTVKQPYPHRNLAILGNHDYVAGEEAVAELRRHLERVGIELLENQAVCVQRGGAGVSFVGMTDEAPGFEDATRDLLSADGPRVVLIHEPDLAERLPYGSANLALSGHTHGGQIAIPPFEGFIVRYCCGSRYVKGIYQVNGTPLYVNQGLGCVGLPLRFRAAPEVTLITLAR